MTAMLEHSAAAVAPVWAIGAPRLLTGLDRAATVDYPLHQALHGSLPAPDRKRLTDLVDQAALRGRGGAGFPFAAKLHALRSGQRPVVVVNGSESEPASFKDRALMQRTPHLVIDGALVVAR